MNFTNKIIALFLSTVVAVLMTSCNPKSYCFFDIQKKMIYLTDTNKITTVSIIDAKNYKLKKEIALEEPLKEYVLDTALISNNENVLIVKTTNYRNRYLLRFKLKDWQQTKPIKFTAQRR